LIIFLYFNKFKKKKEKKKENMQLTFRHGEDKIWHGGCPKRWSNRHFSLWFCKGGREEL
jgi:hypothetical protein